MPSPPKYAALLQTRAELAKRSEALQKDPEATLEQINALTAQLKENAAEIDAWTQLQEAAKAAPATASISVTDNREKDPKCGFRDMADFALSVRKASPGRGPTVTDPRLALVNAIDRAEIGAAPSGYMEENGTVGEGYLVPPEMRQEIWTLVLGDEGILSFLQPEPTSSSAVKFTKDETTPWGAAGVQALWVDAGEQLTASKDATKQALNALYRLAAFVLATDELDTDAPNLASRLTVGAASAINWKAEEACMFGDGVGKPLGWLKGPGLVTQAIEAGQATATIVVNNISKMFARSLNPTQSAWFASKETLPQLMTLTIGNQPIWTPPVAGLRDAPGGFLLGRPVKFSRHCQVLGTVGDIQLVDPTGYILNIRTGGIAYASSIHLFFDYAVNAYRWMFRLGGQPILSAAMSPAKGANTESHFVTLAARP
jgi:HK97 family phage major capsid protein